MGVFKRKIRIVRNPRLLLGPVSQGKVFGSVDIARRAKVINVLPFFFFPLPPHCLNSVDAKIDMHSDFTVKPFHYVRHYPLLRLLSCFGVFGSPFFIWVTPFFSVIFIGLEK